MFSAANTECNWCTGNKNHKNRVTRFQAASGVSISLELFPHFCNCHFHLLCRLTFHRFSMLLPFTNSFSCFSFDVVILGSFSCYSSVVYVHIVVIHLGTFLKFFCRLNSYCCFVFTFLWRVSMFMSSGYVVVSSCIVFHQFSFRFFFPRFSE